MLPRSYFRLKRRFVFLCAAFTGFLALFTTYYNAFPSSLAAYASYHLSPSPILDAALAPIQQQAFSMSTIRPVCSTYSWQADRYADMLNTTNVFLAINFYNNEKVLPTFFQELPILLRHLGPERVFVSVYENGSKDRTHEMLAMSTWHICVYLPALTAPRLAVEDLLTVLRTPHRVVYGVKGEASRKRPGHRIKVLSAVRNRVLEPLYSGSAARHVPEERFDELLFMNDVVFCAVDMLELLHAKRAYGANQACALDWMDAYIYDTWVLRDVRGEYVLHPTSVRATGLADLEYPAPP
jgi:alpha-1,3-mannosyltransferase